MWSHSLDIFVRGIIYVHIHRYNSHKLKKPHISGRFSPCNSKAGSKWIFWFFFNFLNILVDNSFNGNCSNLLVNAYELLIANGLTKKEVWICQVRQSWKPFDHLSSTNLVICGSLVKSITNICSTVWWSSILLEFIILLDSLSCWIHSTFCYRFQHASF